MVMVMPVKSPPEASFDPLELKARARGGRDSLPTTPLTARVVRSRSVILVSLAMAMDEDSTSTAMASPPIRYATTRSRPTTPSSAPRAWSR